MSRVLSFIAIYLYFSIYCEGQSTASNWKYIAVDTSRAKWGDFASPDWLRYFGCDAKDINNDKYLDIVAGRYVYINPGKSMESNWKRIDLGGNYDGMLWIDADGDKLPDIFAEALPNVYWLEATDETLTKWNKIKVAHITATDHVNGQDAQYTQIIEGDNKEILMNAGDGLYMIQIPNRNKEEGYWPVTKISGNETNDEGITFGDMDKDGDIDIISSRNNGKGPKSYVWYANPGKGKETTEMWQEYLVGTVTFWPDRVEVADLNGDGKLDVIGSEERYPGLQPDASLTWWEQIHDLGCILFRPKVLKTSWSMNNLDVADIDKDGDIDIITNEHKGDVYNTYLYINDGKGNFKETIIDKGHEHHLGTKFFDMDNDGDLDVVGPAWDNWKPFHLLRNDTVKK